MWLICVALRFRPADSSSSLPFHRLKLFTKTLEVGFLSFKQKENCQKSLQILSKDSKTKKKTCDTPTNRRVRASTDYGIEFKKSFAKVKCVSSFDFHETFFTIYNFSCLSTTSNAIIIKINSIGRKPHGGKGLHHALIPGWSTAHTFPGRFSKPEPCRFRPSAFF